MKGERTRQCECACVNGACVNGACVNGACVNGVSVNDACVNGAYGCYTKVLHSGAYGYYVQ